MTHHQRFLFIFLLTFLTANSLVKSQTIEELEAELALLEAELDSVSISGFIDSLINLNETPSTLTFRNGYSSQVFNNGQDLGIEQFGLNTSISFFHQSGIYGNYTGFFNSQTEPRYFLSTLSAGYFGKISSRLNYNLSYERLFFHNNSSNVLSNSVSGTVSYGKKLLFSLTYSFLFGQETAHQVIPSLSWSKSIKNPWFFKSIDISPTINLFWANPNIVSSNFTEIFLRETWLINQLTDAEIRALFAVSNNRGVTLYDAVLSAFRAQENNNFILLNSSISLPVNFQISNKLSAGIIVSYLISDDLILGSVERNERRIALLGRIFPRLESELNNLDDTITFDAAETSVFFSINLSYSINFK